MEKEETKKAQTWAKAELKKRVDEPAERDKTGRASFVSADHISFWPKTSPKKERKGEKGGGGWAVFLAGALDRAAVL